MKLTFLGGADTVTGSKTLLETGGRRIMIDCGQYQGLKELRLRNWSPLPVAPEKIECVILTHAHIDHSGYIPLLVRNGFSGDIYCTEATRDLCAVLLPDSGYLHEKDAAYACKHGFSKHRPALPLYSEADARASLDRFRPVDFDSPLSLGGDLTVTFRNAGHILGAAQARLDLAGVKILFSGDLGRVGDPLMFDPAPGGETDYLVVESTYGGRSHGDEDPEQALSGIINRTVGRGGTVVVPSFAVGRAQLLMYYLMRLKQRAAIPDLPVFLDSPMAIDASEIFHRHRDRQRLDDEALRSTMTAVTYVREVEKSKALDGNRMPKVILSASGMATGGRVLHHLKHYASDHRNTILFAGYQAPGTRGDHLLRGAGEVKIHGRQIPVRAEVASLDMLSAHADEDGIVDWLATFAAPPRMTFVNHGEAAAAASLVARIGRELGWSCRTPDYARPIALTSAD